MFNADFLGTGTSILSCKDGAGDEKLSKGSISEDTASRQNLYPFHAGALWFETSLRMYEFELLTSFFGGGMSMSLIIQPHKCLQGLLTAIR